VYFQPSPGFPQVCPFERGRFQERKEGKKRTYRRGKKKRTEKKKRKEKDIQWKDKKEKDDEKDQSFRLWRQFTFRFGQSGAGL
jgi:hypothetical protein